MLQVSGFPTFRPECQPTLVGWWILSEDEEPDYPKIDLK